MVYYAVARGYYPGIYRSWYDCQLQVCGFPGSDYRKIFCYGDAVRFLYRKGIPIHYNCGNYGEDEEDTDYFYYAVAIGRNPGIYHTSWDDCKDEVLNYPGAQYRKYFCIDDALSFMRRRCRTEIRIIEAPSKSLTPTTPPPPPTSTMTTVKIEPKTEETSPFEHNGSTQPPVILELKLERFSTRTKDTFGDHSVLADKRRTSGVTSFRLLSLISLFSIFILFVGTLLYKFL